MGQEPAEVMQMTQALLLSKANNMMKKLQMKVLEFASKGLGKVWSTLFIRNLKSDFVKCFMPR